MKIWYGGDYNPEQWDSETVEEDIALMGVAGVNLVTINVFGWAIIEPREGEFDFSALDELIARLGAAGIGVDLATGTASPPPWLTTRYPEMLPVRADGTRLSQGSRQEYCPSSPVYREASLRLTRALVSRYAAHPSIELWHINNEYGGHNSHCYCDVSAAAFRDWLEHRYGTVDELNAAWSTTFWSQRYDSFAEILPPRVTSTHGNPMQLQDFDIFSTHELMECYRGEVAIVRELSPGIPLTTNFMGFFKRADYWTWAREVDIVSNDAYPDPADPDAAAYAAMNWDLMRSLSGGRPWMLMEQAASAVNWRAANQPKAPGQMRAWSLQAVARGARSVLFFQWRQSAGGAEQYHSAMLPHAHTRSRVWREVRELGAELQGLSALGADLDVGLNGLGARVAIVFDWPSWWAIEQEHLPTAHDYLRHVFAWYLPLWQNDVPVDFVRAGDDLSRFDVVITPSTFTMTDQAAESIDRFVLSGGTLVATYQTAVVDEVLRVRRDGYLGPLAHTLGIWIEEFTPPAGADLWEQREEAPSVSFRGPAGRRLMGSSWAEVLHTDTASAVAEFDSGPANGHPAVTRNERGHGVAWYVATQPDREAMRELLVAIGVTQGVEPIDPALERVERGGLVFLINHGSVAARVRDHGTDLLTGDREPEWVPSFGVRIMSNARSGLATPSDSDRDLAESTIPGAPA
ncbi:beta-galactosidase [Compostimonas suwonensis]|uniref:Beta-galactosidase n=1 Tax=Compostimonas suwonensis TaxID=1048394 RepID=A0A2M9BVA2_9MICO|nr:beta-galactosidase [Compostimonas suwonensis]PJJ61876.1 beta-galactosidase [Compostimonas suwonensis]